MNFFDFSFKKKIFFFSRDVRTSKDTSQRGRGRSDRGRSERSNRGRGGSSLVQTSGLFSEGAAGGNKTRSSSGSNYGSSASDSAVAQMRRPTLVKREFKIDPEEEERQIQEILGDDSDEFDEETIKASTMPVMLTDREFKFLFVLKVVFFFL